MTQPTFWLKVKPDYILDNFEGLIRYLRDYKYVANERNTDFDSTLDCMEQLMEEILERLISQPLYIPATLDYDLSTISRLFAAVILASQKKGITATKAIQGLIMLFCRTNICSVNKHLDSYYDIILRCIRQQKLLTAGFDWDIIIAPDFHPSRLALTLTGMKFNEASTEHVKHYYEGKGTVVVSETGMPGFAPLNLQTYERGKTCRQFRLDDMMDIIVRESEESRIKDFNELYTTITRILLAQDDVKPSIEPTKAVYGVNDEIIVRIISKQGYAIVAESVDPAYQKIEGKVYYKNYLHRPDRNLFADALSVGDYLLVKLSDYPNYTFDISEIFEQIYREWACELTDEEIDVVYYKPYAKGQLWITYDGIVVGVEDSKYKYADIDIRQEYDEAIESGRPIRLNTYDRTPENKPGKPFYMYADFGEIYTSYGTLMSDCEPFTANKAQSDLVKDYVARSGDIAVKYEDSKNSTVNMLMSEYDVFSMMAVIARVWAGGIRSSRERFLFVSVLAMMCKLLQRNDDLEYMQFQCRYIRSLIGFAKNTPVELKSPAASFESVPEVKRMMKVYGTIMDYKRHDDLDSCKVSPEEKACGPLMTNAEKLEKLITASNSLQEILDVIELDKIKRIIARNLGVEDEYESILDKRTFYGMENINLEFKASAVFAPYNRRQRNSDPFAPDIQRWAIIKAVCGFLNSRNGGELLIGVNDAGYAMGIAQDIDELAKHKLISSSTPDAYRTYIQNMIEHAFQVSDPKVKSTDIARSTTTYDLEENEEMEMILRIKVNPYPNDIVSLRDDGYHVRPDNLGDSFVRQNGATVEITKELEPIVISYKKRR